MTYRPDAPIIEATEATKAHRLWSLEHATLIDQAPDTTYVIHLTSKVWPRTSPGEAVVPLIHASTCHRIQRMTDLPVVANRTNAKLFREESALRDDGKIRYDWCSCARRTDWTAATPTAEATEATPEAAPEPVAV